MMFKEWYLLNEVRWAEFAEPIKLIITQPAPLPGGKTTWTSTTKECAGIDLKIEFYDNPIKVLNAGWIQQFPPDVRTRPGQVLVNEGYSKGQELYWLDVPPMQLAQILNEGHAYVDWHSHKLVTHERQGETIKVLMVNPLSRGISSHQLKHGPIALRQGWDQKPLLSWFDFAELVDVAGNYAKRSCHYDPSELVDILDKAGAA